MLLPQGETKCVLGLELEASQVLLVLRPDKPEAVTVKVESIPGAVFLAPLRPPVPRVVGLHIDSQPRLLLGAES